MLLGIFAGFKKMVYNLPDDFLSHYFNPIVTSDVILKSDKRYDWLTDLSTYRSNNWTDRIKIWYTEYRHPTY